MTFNQSILEGLNTFAWKFVPFWDWSWVERTFVMHLCYILYANIYCMLDLSCSSLCQYKYAFRRDSHFGWITFLHFENLHIQGVNAHFFAWWFILTHHIEINVLHTMNMYRTRIYIFSTPRPTFGRKGIVVFSTTYLFHHMTTVSYFQGRSTLFLPSTLKLWPPSWKCYSGHCSETINGICFIFSGHHD